MKLKISFVLLTIIIAYLGYKQLKKINFNSNYKVGQKIDSLNNVTVFFNGGVSNTAGRNVTKDGYNLSIRYQCVEFVKRYYYEYLNHKMPDSYGNALDFYNTTLEDGEWNNKRNLKQCKNGGISIPKINDIIIFNKNLWNKYGHVAIIADINGEFITIIQQNKGSFGKTREKLKLIKQEGKYYIDNERILGWLNKPSINFKS